jgi:YidC/Oxa1 family membrane protein insertase
VIPDQSAIGTTQFRDLGLPSGDGWQVNYTVTDGQTVAPGGEVSFASQAFAGAKEVKLLDHYEAANNIPSFDKAVDFGWFYFVSKPIFYALDWLYGKIGNFGVASMALTVIVKILFFPLANKSYRSMNKMKLLAPKMQAIRERLKDDPTQMQSETMALYKTEGVNPMSGCLPLVVQIPVMIALNTDLRISIEMRHAPFFGWIHDLSAPDPTNLFNLFGLIPFDPATYLPLLQIGIWPILMGAVMYVSQQMNPPMPDPVQARMMKFMPLIFTFMMARYSAGLVIYWTWNSLLGLGQQWLMTRPSRKAALVVTK